MQINKINGRKTTSKIDMAAANFRGKIMNEFTLAEMLIDEIINVTLEGSDSHWLKAWKKELRINFPPLEIKEIAIMCCIEHYDEQLFIQNRRHIIEAAKVIENLSRAIIVRNICAHWFHKKDDEALQVFASEQKLTFCHRVSPKSARLKSLAWICKPMAAHTLPIPAK